MASFKISEENEKLLRDYYIKYYKDQLGIPNFESYVQKRLNEEQSLSKRIDALEKYSNIKFGKGQKVLIVGAGTGAEYLAFALRGCDTYAIEPDKTAFEIMKRLLKENNFSTKNIAQESAENMSFESNFFDFVYCWTVLEHVENVECSIKEMIRVTKPNDLIYIVCPDYRQIWEGHYKLFLPLFLPVWLIKFILVLKGRQTKFIQTINFVNAKKLKILFRNFGLIALQIHHPYDSTWERPKGWNKLVKWIQDNMEINRDQHWLLIKKEDIV
jgi:SAM-dependent methyltransferase